ncbi:MAG: DUF1573 domain-containing protein, partial [Ferruginibacter sp.]
MKKFLLILIATSALAACDIRRHDKVVDDAAQQKATALLDTTIVQLIDSSYNFGKITEGEKVTYNYRFKNIGTKPMVITSATAG